MDKIPVSVKDAFLLAVASATVGFGIRFASLPQRVDNLEKTFSSMDQKLDILIQRGQ